MKLLPAVMCLAAAGCATDSDAPCPPPPPAQAPIRGAVGDSDLRVMISELASSQACALIEGRFRGLQAADDPGLVTGVLWIRDCKIENAGTKVTFQFAGSGWQWTAATKHKAGGTFAVEQYVKFDVETTIRGAFDIAYDRESHIASLYFSPSTRPDVKVTPIGGVEVDSQGVWSSVVGALGSVFASSPEDTAEREIARQGAAEMKNQLADGVAATIDLCTGLSRFTLGRPPKGHMGGGDAGETRRAPVDLQPGGLLLFGPEVAAHGMSLQIDVTRGGVLVELMCEDEAASVAAGFLAGQAAAVAPLASATIRGEGGKLAIEPTPCRVVTIVEPVDDRAATFTLARPAKETARAAGGPLIHCAARPPPP